MRVVERADVGGIELHAGRDARRQRRLVGVDHGVGEAADARHQRRRAIAQRAELRQAAGLEARRHDEEIDAGLDQMRERLVIADDAADLRRDSAAAMARKPCSSMRLARAEQRQLAAALDQARQAGEQQVEPLLARQPRDDAEQRRRRRPAASPNFALQRAPCWRRGPRASARCRSAASVASVSGFQISSSMPLTMPSTSAARRAQQAVERHAELGREDLARIGRRDRGDLVGEPDAAFEKADAAEIFDAVDAASPRAAGRAAPSRSAVVMALERHVVERQHRPRPRAAVVVEIDRAPAPPANRARARRRRRRPGTTPLARSAPARASAAKRKALSGQSRPSGPR